MGRKVNYFEAQRNYNPTDDTHLSVVVSAAVPSVLSAIETRKGRSFWKTPQEFSDAYQALTKQQWELLMDASERINRAIFYAMGYPRNVELAPDGFPAIELPEATLFAIRTRLGDPGDPTLVTILTSIREELRANGPNGEGLGELIKALVLYLAV